VRKFFLPIIFLVLFLAIYLPRFFINVKIDCRSQFGACPPEVADGVSSLNGKKMFFARRELDKSLKTNFIVSAYSIQFKLPNFLRIDVVVKKPIFALKNMQTGTFAQIDKQGTVIAQSSSTTLPYAVTQSPLPDTGGKVDAKHLFALELMDGVNKMFQVKSGMISNDTLLVDIPGGVRVIFPLVDADREILLGSLKLIYTSIQSGENSNLYSQVDLRYKNPVLR